MMGRSVGLHGQSAGDRHPRNAIAWSDLSVQDARDVGDTFFTIHHETPQQRPTDPGRT